MDSLDFRLGTNSNEITASPQISPNALRPLVEQAGPSDLDSKEALKPLERRNTIDKAAMSPTGLGISNTPSDVSRPASRVFTSPTISSRRTSMTEFTNSTSRRDSIISLEHAVLQKTMENLNGVQVSYYKAKSRISYPISKIESILSKQNGRRYIIISPHTSVNIKFYFSASQLYPQV